LTIWVATDSKATVNGIDLGETGPRSRAHDGHRHRRLTRDLSGRSEVSISAAPIRLLRNMQGIRILEARDHIAQAAYAAMRRVEAEAARCRVSRTPRDTVGRSPDRRRRH
jgi:hypothetical protein